MGDTKNSHQDCVIFTDEDRADFLQKEQQTIDTLNRTIPDFRFAIAEYSDIQVKLEEVFAHRHKGKFHKLEIETEGEHMLCGFGIYNYESPYKANAVPFILFQKGSSRFYELYCFRKIFSSNTDTYSFDDAIEDIMIHHSDYQSV